MKKRDPPPVFHDLSFPLSLSLSLSLSLVLDVLPRRFCSSKSGRCPSDAEKPDEATERNRCALSLSSLFSLPSLFPLTPGGGQRTAQQQSSRNESGAREGHRSRRCKGGERGGGGAKCGNGGDKRTNSPKAMTQYRSAASSPPPAAQAAALPYMYARMPLRLGRAPLWPA